MDIKSVLFNLVLSIVFAILGARNATSNIEMSNWTVNRKKMNNVNEQVNIIIDELYILNAINENSAVSIDELRTDIPNNILKRRIQTMKKRKIIKEINNKYYINENRMD